LQASFLVAGWFLGCRLVSWLQAGFLVAGWFLGSRLVSILIEK